MLKKSFFTLILIIGLNLSAFAAYTLKWADEFDGPTVNANNWTYETGGGGWGNQESQTYTNNSKNSYIDSNGYLHIVAIQNGTSYTSARMITYNKLHARYGRIEARIKCPAGAQGVWPAFWLLGSNKDWPYCGEIDIMEQMCKSSVNTWKTTLTTLHWNRNGIDGEYGTGDYGRSKTLSEELGAQFRIYGVEWTPTKIIGYYSDQFEGNCDESHREKVFEMGITGGSGIEAFVNNEFFIILNFAVGGTFVDKKIEKNFGTREMVVDWVRVYQDTDAYPTSILRNNTGTTPDGRDRTAPAANCGTPKVTIEGNTDITGGNPVTLTAKTNIENPYYTWNSGGVTQVFEVGTMGSHTVSVSNGNNCKASASVSVTSSDCKPTISVLGVPDVVELPFTITISTNLQKPTYAWSNGNVSSKFKVSSRGSYKVTVSDPTNCTVTASIKVSSASVTVSGDTPVGIQSETKKDIQVYPNPTIDELNMNIPDDINVQSIELYDMSGRMIERYPIDTRTISLGNYFSGMYLLIVRYDDGVIRKRIVLQ